MLNNLRSKDGKAHTIEETKAGIKIRLRIYCILQDLHHKASVTVLYLRSFCKNEFRILHQALKRHSYVNDSRPFVFSTVVRHKLAIPGIEDDQTCYKSRPSKWPSLDNQIQIIVLSQPMLLIADTLLGLTHFGLLRFDNSTHRLLHQQNLRWKAISNNTACICM